ncbi:zinc finger CCHC domain-containing protein 7 isoform X2 [Cucumis melo var. makuwa]|uniref:Zinc finger CCHC domain-containing protein 7 isoform X2 n=2 Tax=Cucumis melo TaxID=3656 RepID=A0A5A7UTU3_CUCMM|nr:uncharacterized protein LOC103494199 isoform X2 [Cucumis melo]KAA0058157.1 zinc finger CCHC domain-containing protein 7 isoform X2 [Cucumis melo var. makuwa]
MGRRIKQKKFKFEDDDDELQVLKTVAPKFAKSLSSDDDEANEDLSLKIVEKAMQLRSGKLVTDAGVNKDGKCEQSGNGDVAAVGAIELVPSSLEGADADAGTSKASADSIATASKKTVKKRKKKVKKLGTEERDAVVTEGEKIETTGVIDQVDSVEPNSTATTDNNVFRKLLRGPRYFDPPDSWGTCYNCGEEGHNAVNCTSAKRKRPCFVCGSLEHNAKSCSKARDCFICKKGGHRANVCPEKHKNVSSSLKICLKCGDSGHDMFSCQNHYADDDLKKIQCYICKKFGHLCCVNSTSDTSVVSCYKCGQTGHTGLSCSRLRGEASGAVSSSQCYRCGEEGHFARECTSSTKSGKRNREEASGAASPSPCYKCGEEGHFARECTSSTKGGKRILEETSGAASPSSCYRCGEQGHFARDCAGSTKGGKRIIEEPSVFSSPSLCYRCGELGHFARECTSSTKGGKRNRELSNPKWRSQVEETDYMGSKSAPHDLVKAHDKKKKMNHEEKYSDLPRKSGQRGRWMMEDPGPNFSHGTFNRNDWNSPVTPSRWGHDYYAEYNGQYTDPHFSGHYASPQFSGHYSNHQSFTKRHTLHPGTPQYGYSASRFGGFSHEGRSRSYGWW